MEEDARSAHGLTFIAGDLCNPAAYRASLEGVDTVAHLAALTGKAAPEDFERTNVAGTEALLKACQDAGVKKFLYVSTIAAAYPDTRYYIYAQSKQRAEALVRASGIPFAIIRPTIVVGHNSPIWQSLSKIARLPIVPLPDGGRVKIQPIHVDDLVTAIELLLDEGRFDGEVLDLGGPSPIGFVELLRLTHKVSHGQDPRCINVPLGPIRHLLALVEPLARPVLPVTAGPLAVFANDRTVTPNRLHDRVKHDMPSAAETVSALAAEEKTPVAAPDLDRECDVFSRCLVDEKATPYIHTQYEAALKAKELADDTAFSSFDRKTLRLARRNVAFANLADAYCALFHRNGALRRKLVLLLAILEHTTPTNAHFDRPKPRGVIGLLAQLFLSGVRFSAALLAGTILLLPSHLMFTFRERQT
jgi:nucleoside-diphosphate-sugar epimerase